MNNVILKQGRERSLLRRHPWVFSGAVHRVEGEPQSGETVDVLSADGKFLGCGAWSPASQIRIRIWTFEQDETVDGFFFRRRLQAAIRLRDSLGIPSQSTAFRLVSSEADGLPGLIVDRYGDFLVCQFLSAGTEWQKDLLVGQLQELTGLEHVYERSDVEIRKKEGLEPCKGCLAGQEPPSLLAMEEHGLKFLIDVKEGHKTGFYLDQRDNRHLVRSLSTGADVLNCFSYTGGFGLAALHGGARHVTNVDDRAELVAMTDRHLELNGFSGESCDNLRADVFQLLRRFHKDGRQFDLVILDPPKFAESQATLERACRGYKDINLLAFKLLRPGGMLFTFSCSGLMKPDLFQKIVADAAADSGKEGQILQWLGQAADHPVKLAMPETQYLKGLLVRAGD